MIFKVGARNILRNPRRTLAILITVALGTGSLFIFHGFNAGIMNGYRDGVIHARYGHGQINERNYRNQVYEKPWEHWLGNWAELKPALLAIPGVKQVFPRTSFYALLTNGKITVSGKGQGIDGPEEAKFFTALNVVEGVNLSNQADGILLGSGLAHALDVHVGDRVTVLANTTRGSLNGVDLNVTGISHTGSQEFDDVFFRIPIPQSRILLDSDLIEEVTLGLDQEENWKNVSALVATQYPKLEATSYAVLDRVWYQNSVDWLESQFGVIEGIILTIVILSIFNTVSMLILERKHEIGALRANGESILDVMQLFFAEGLVLGILGAVLGILIGLFVSNVLVPHGILMPTAPGLTRQFYVMIDLEPRMASKTFLLGVMTAVSGTLVAGYRVAKMPIGFALRST